MFIIPAAGMAKVVMAVTISLQPVAHQDPAGYTVRAGDSLSAIAAHAYGSAADWPAVWWANRHQVANPNVLVAGQRFRSRTFVGVEQPSRLEQRDAVCDVVKAGRDVVQPFPDPREIQVEAGP